MCLKEYSGRNTEHPVQVKEEKHTNRVRCGKNSFQCIFFFIVLILVEAFIDVDTQF